jgi:hypothetical protein
VILALWPLLFPTGDAPAHVTPATPARVAPAAAAHVSTVPAATIR